MAPVPMTSMMQLGGLPLELSPYVCVQLAAPGPKERFWTLTVWRTSKAPEGLCPRPGESDVVECEGEVVSASICASRLDRGLARADAEVVVEGGAGELKTKLWLPREAALRARWERAFEAFGAVSALEGDAEAGWVLDVATRLADGALPNGWELFKDPGSGSDYFVRAETGETTWTRPLTEDAGRAAAAAPPPPPRALALAWLLQHSLGDEVDALLSGEA